jgi:hypothetical protein
MTQTTTRASGPSTAASKVPPASGHGDPYLEVCEELHNLLTRKRGYYGCAQEHPLENALGVEEQGIEPWVYQLVRIGEKVRRCGGLNGAIVNSGERMDKIKKTLMDIAGHAVVAVAIINNEIVK